jgi:hypothetical protein
MRAIPFLALALVTLAAAAAERWASFAAYPGARQLCDEHVAGTTMHISWRSYATADPVATVVAFYEKDQGKKAERGEHGDFTLHAPARDDDAITVFPAAEAAAFPGCAEKARKTEKTIILVSSRAGPSR